MTLQEYRQRLAGIAVLAFLCCDPVSAAEPWEGTWAPEGHESNCAREPEGDGGWLLRMSTRMDWGVYTQGGENGDESPKGDAGQIIFDGAADPVWCNIGKTSKRDGMNIYEFDVECGGEGSIWPWRYVVMLPADYSDFLDVSKLVPNGRQLLLFDGYEVSKFTLCKRDKP